MNETPRIDKNTQDQDHAPDAKSLSQLLNVDLKIIDKEVGRARAADALNHHKSRILEKAAGKSPTFHGWFSDGGGILLMQTLTEGAGMRTAICVLAADLTLHIQQLAAKWGSAPSPITLYYQHPVGFRSSDIGPCFLLRALLLQLLRHTPRAEFSLKGLKGDVVGYLIRKLYDILNQLPKGRTVYFILPCLSHYETLDPAGKADGTRQEVDSLLGFLFELASNSSRLRASVSVALMSPLPRQAGFIKRALEEVPFGSGVLLKKKDHSGWTS
ncbi:hypothetical protein BU26DRAFT_560347 [Trematosphaeria pertusa]|uniref:Uncharacterized protein n=1 Tax=Trematosphaeria pertusa TaxID=390896 RepID=A0A6A6IR38_9PLEO|nr:uncharacterized protein BU26DRAFT_560347 [Trematosphaeria pertusa]KAF2253004.1 hypothetical protein BU26DRAFT_560347 [Trematosphaeria pertusa]